MMSIRTAPDEAAAMTLRNPSVVSISGLPAPPCIEIAMLTGTNASVAATVHQNDRRVRSFKSSARMRVFTRRLLQGW